MQNNASKLLLAIMESRHDSENAERILYNMSPKQLVRPQNQMVKNCETMMKNLLYAKLCKILEKSRKEAIFAEKTVVFTEENPGA